MKLAERFVILTCFKLNQCSVSYYLLKLFSYAKEAMKMGSRKTNVLFRDLKKTYPMVDRAEGVYLYDSEGKRYIDGSGGAIVVDIGHGVDEVLDRIFEQAKKICSAHTSQFTNEAQEKLANKVRRIGVERDDHSASSSLSCRNGKSIEI